MMMKRCSPIRMAGRDKLPPEGRSSHKGAQKMTLGLMLALASDKEMLRGLNWGGSGL